MRVLLVNPPPYQIIEPYYDTPNYPRTALACLAGYLREKKVDVHVLDCKFDRIDYDGARDHIRTLQPDLVGFTGFTNEIKQSARLAEMIKVDNPGIRTVIGGVHVTALPEETLREFPEFDYGVIGEGEESLYQLTTHLNDKKALTCSPGVAFINEHEQYVYGGDRPKIVDQDALPFPAWDLFRPAEEYILQTLRGCPFTCEFCMNPNGRAVRTRSPENVLNEIQWLIETQKPKSILFGDEIFTISRERSLAICRGMIDRGFHKKLTWWCQTHVRTVDLELVQLMKESNCRLVGLGIESGDDEKLRAMGKGTNLKSIFEAVALMKRVGLPFMTFFILGQPNETYESASETITFAVKLNPTLPIFGIMVPYPGTKIAEMAQKGDGGYVLLSRDWNEYNKQFGNALEFKHLSRSQLESLQFWGYLKVFVKNFRFMDLARFIWKYRTEGISVLKKKLRMGIAELSVFVPFRPNRKKLVER